RFVEYHHPKKFIYTPNPRENIFWGVIPPPVRAQNTLNLPSYPPSAGRGVGGMDVFRFVNRL
ncbi:MAG: hypothetical protein ROW39_02140, partial [Anaerolineaceae bacterium]